MDMSMTKWMENFRGFQKCDVLAAEHLAKRGIVGNANDAGGDLDGKMQIPNQPSQPRARRGISKRYLKNRFRLLGDDISGAIITKERSPIAKGLLEVKPKFPPILRAPVPPPLRQRQPVNGKPD